MKILSYSEIGKAEWENLILTSLTGTWFQSPEAYEFYASMPELFRPFVVGITRDAKHLDAERLDPADLELRTRLRGVCVGYITVEKSAFKQMMTRRAIIVGGPCLADDCSDDEVTELMMAVRKALMNEPLHSMSRDKSLNEPRSLNDRPIYIESRNFNDYSRWKSAFEKAGFEYVPHLNFHVDTSSVEVVDANLGKSRKRDIRTTIREGVSVIEHPTDEQVCEYYKVLDNLYRTKVKTPLFPLSFFLALNKHKDGRLLLIEYQGRIIGGTVCVVFNRDKFETINHKFETTTHPSVVYEWFVCGEDGVYPHVFPSSYATYAGIKYAAEHGCARFDMMGAGKPDEAYGVRDFKAKFGGTEVEHGRFLCVTKPMLYKIGALGVKLLKRLK